MRSLLASSLFAVLSLCLLADASPARASNTDASPFAGRFTGVIHDGGPLSQPDLRITLKIHKDGRIKGFDAETDWTPGVALRVTGQIDPASGFGTIKVFRQVGEEWVLLFYYLEQFAFLDGSTLYFVDLYDTSSFSILTRD